MGSIPSSSAAACTLALIGTRGPSSTIPTLLFCAISCSVLASPPRVGSFIAISSSPPASIARRTSPLSGATSESRSPSRSSAMTPRHHGQTMIADRAGDYNLVAGPEPAVRNHTACERDAGGVKHDAVDFAAAHHLGVAGDNGGSGFARMRR